MNIVETNTLVYVYQEGKGFITVKLLHDKNRNTFYWEKNISYMPSGYSTEDQAIQEALDVNLVPFSNIPEIVVERKVEIRTFSTV